jgi:hypothetical protein
MVVGVVGAVLIENFEMPIEISKQISIAMLFAITGLLGSYLYILLINLMLPIRINLRRSILIISLSMLCGIPVLYHLVVTENAPLVESTVLFLEPMLWWSGVSVGLVCPLRRTID